MNLAFTSAAYYNDSFPLQESNRVFIPREVELEELSSLLLNNNAVSVSGEEGIGVTTLLSQFVLQNSSNTISYFFNEFYTDTFSSGYIERCLMKQIYYIVHGVAMPDGCEDNLISIKSLFQQKIRQNSIFYFVLDGLDSVPVEYQDDVRHILSKLPLQQFKILMSGDINKIKWASLASSCVASNKLLRFSRNAVLEYLRTLNPGMSKEQALNICTITKCIGANISHVLDVIQCDGGIDNVLAHEMELTRNIYFFVDKIINSDEAIKRLLSLIAYSKFKLSKSIISNIMHFEENRFDTLLSSLNLLLAPKTDTVDFRDYHVKKYVADRLKQYRMDAEIDLIKLLQSDSQYNPNILDLYKNVNQKENLVKLLHLDTLQTTLEQEQSQSIINVQCEYGYQASSDIVDEIRFAIIKSTSREIEKNELWDYEIEALILSNQTEVALSLAQNVFLKEEQLKCFAIIARYEKYLTLDQTELVRNNISRLVANIAFDQIPEKSIELAKLLLPIDINKAMTIVEKILLNKQSKLNADKLYTMLSLSVSENLTDSGKNDSSNFEELKAKIQDDNLKLLAEAMRSVMSDSKPEELIKRLDMLSSYAQRIYILQFWIPEHRTQKGIDVVLEYAIQQVIADSGLEVPRACILSEFCKALPYVTKEDVLMKLLSQISAVEESVKYPTEHYVQIKLFEVESIAHFDIHRSIEMLTELYVYVDDIKNISTKINSLALMLSRYPNYALDKQQLQKEWFTEAKLLQTIKDYIASEYRETAYHLKLVKKSIECLVCNYHSFVFDIVKNMNTEERRSKAYLVAAVEYVKQTAIEKLDWEYFKRLMASVKIIKEFQSRPYIYIARKFARMEDGPAVAKTIAMIKSLNEVITALFDEEDKCLILSDIIIGLNNVAQEDEYITYCAERLYDTWKKIKDTQTKLLLGFRLYKRLYKYQIPLINTILEEALKLKKESVLSTSSCAVACNISLDLYARSVINLIHTNCCTDKDLSELDVVLKRIGDVGETMVVWSRCVVAYYIIEEVKQAKSLFQTHILPYLDEMSNATRYSHYVLFQVSPALYIYSDELFKHYLALMPEYLSNACINYVCGFIFQQSPYVEDLDDKTTFFIEYDKLLELVKLLRLSNDDQVLFSNIDTICQSIVERKNKSLTSAQITKVLQDLNEIVDTAFPTPMGIQHDGYKLACQIAIRGANKALVDKSAIDTIKNEIDKIPNNADKAFLYFYASQYVSKMADKRNFIDFGIDKSKEIPYGFDKYERFSYCLSSSNAISQDILKRSFDMFIKEINGDKDSDYDYGEKVIDLAYQYNEDLADIYVEMCDKDPGRQYNKRALHKCLERTKVLKSVDKDISKVKELSPAEYEKYFAKRYISAFAGRVMDAPVSKMHPVIQSIFQNPLSSSENAVKYLLVLSKLKTQVYARQLYTALYTNMKIALSLSAMSQSDVEKLQRNIRPLSHDDALITIGEKERGMDMIVDWYKHHPYNELMIIDAYFGLRDLAFLKRFLDVNNSLRISILTHAKGIEDMSVFQQEWKKHFDEITGEIVVKKVVYIDNNTDGPLHDRHWICFSNRKSDKVGLQSNSSSGIGEHMSTILPMPPETINSIWENEVENFFYFQEPYQGERKLRYDSVIIK